MKAKESNKKKVACYFSFLRGGNWYGMRPNALSGKTYVIWRHVYIGVNF